MDKVTLFPKYSYDLSLEKSGDTRFISWIIGCLMCIAMLSLFAWLSTGTMLENWENYARQTMTIEVLENAEIDTQTLQTHFKDVAFIQDVRFISKTETSALLRDVLGDSETTGALPVPDLFELTFTPNLKDQTRDNFLQGFENSVVIHPHTKTATPILTYGKILHLGSILLMIIVCSMTIFTLVFSTRTRVKIHTDEIQTLSIIGADNRYIAQQFQHYTLHHMLKGAGIGLLAALIILGAVCLALETPTLTVIDVVIWSVIPLVTAAIVIYTTTRLTLDKTLRELNS